jgi:hypothetical protein
MTERCAACWMREEEENSFAALTASQLELRVFDDFLVMGCSVLQPVYNKASTILCREERERGWKGGRMWLGPSS